MTENKYSYLSNTIFLLIEKLIRIIITFILLIWIANYLGAEDFGLLNYSISFVFLFSAFVSLGLDKFIPKELILREDDSKKIIASSIILRLLGSLILIILINFFALFYKPNDQLFQTLIFLISIGFIFKSFEIFKFWFDTKTLSIYSSFALSISFLIISSFKIYLIIYEYSIEYFALAVSLEFIFQGIFLSIFFVKLNTLSILKNFSIKEVKYILIQTWPLIFASLLHDIYSKVDKIMIGDILNYEQVGIYTSATNISEAWLFIPVVIATSLFPALLKLKKNEFLVEYYTLMNNLLVFMVVISLIVGIFVTFLSESIIDVLYKNEYKDSYLVLIIHIWGGLFISMSSITNRILIVENLQKLILFRGLVGLVINFFLNLLLIPIFGIEGAAFSTVFSLFIILFIFNYFNKKTKTIFFSQLKAFNILNYKKSLLFIVKFLKKRHHV